MSLTTIGEAKHPTSKLPWQETGYTHADAELWANACLWLEKQPVPHLPIQNFPAEFQILGAETAIMQTQRLYLAERCLLPFFYKDGVGCSLKPDWQERISVLMTGNPQRITQHMQKQVAHWQQNAIVPMTLRYRKWGERSAEGVICTMCRSDADTRKHLIHYGQCPLRQLEERLAH